jgi:hypothetical protein
MNKNLPLREREKCISYLPSMIRDSHGLREMGRAP